MPLLVLGAGLAVSCSPLYDLLGGDFAGAPEALREEISPEALALLERAFAGVEGAGLWDFHVHLLGLGAGGTGAFVNERMESPWHVFEHFRAEVYKSAAGVRDDENADAQYVDRLRRLVRQFPPGARFALLALDKHYRRDGTVDLDRTQFYVPNGYVVRVARALPERFVPIVSVHPYRPDALAELRRWAAQGVRYVKWLPNAMGIDPADARNDTFYRFLADNGMVLLTHAGEEQAVSAEEDQHLGNPLLLRRALDLGVTVIMAHSASLGSSVDLDSPARERVSNFDLFLRMMGEAKYDGRLFGEISALPFHNRFDGPLQTLLERTDLHPRLVNGSDYPLPAVNLLVRTGELAEAGLLSEAERDALNEIYRYNPLLFDFVLKRTLRHPGSGARFAPQVFGSPFHAR